LSSTSNSPVGSREMFSSRSVTLVSWPAAVRPDPRRRRDDNRYRVRATTSALTSGSASSRIATRIRSFCEVATAATRTASPAATKERPRVVRPWSASRT
jgi:hypothetical protein